MASGRELGIQMLDAVRAYVGRAVGSFGERLTQLSTRLDALEKREPVVGPPGPPGKDGWAVKGDAGEPGLNAYQIAQECGFKGTAEEWLVSLRGEPGAPGESVVGPQGPAGKDGESVDPETVREMVTDAVAVLLAEMPKPKDGAPGMNGEPGSPGRDGRDALQLEILPAVDPERRYPRNTYARHAGGLIRAFRDTDAITLAEIEKSGWEVVLEGIAGETEETLDEGRTITRTTVYTSGKKLEREIKTACLLDRGVWRAGTYEKGDVVSFGGSVFIAQRTTEDKPETSDAFRLAVKRGRDGKDK